MAAGKGKEARNAIVCAAKILSGASFDLICRSELIEEAKREFANAKSII